MINFQFFPRSHGLTPEMRQIIDCFVAVDTAKSKNQHLQSNDMLALVRPHLEACGFRVETGKKKEEKIDVPVLFGENNEVDKSFFADALSRDGRMFCADWRVCPRWTAGLSCGAMVDMIGVTMPRSMSRFPFAGRLGGWKKDSLRMMSTLLMMNNALFTIVASNGLRW